ncbi:MAG: SPOR domain-containing protein [Acetobacteraceae bacterium]|nr:SPOR domain-containing protein [Acetobacteraceae bacterium]
MDPALQRLLMYAGGVVVVAAVIGGVSMLFSRHGGPVPVVQADPRPLRVKPDHPGGMQIAGSADPAANDGTTTGKLAPAPETPDPTALRAPPAPVPVPQAAAPATAPTALATPPVPAAPAPAARSAVVPAVPPAARTAAAAAPRTAVPPEPAAAAQASAAHAAAKPAPVGKSPAIQLAALASEDAAKTEWQHMEHRMPELLGGRTPSYSKIEVGGRTYWRVRVSGFGDVAQAKTFCDRVRAKNASCSVADF